MPEQREITVRATRPRRCNSDEPRWRPILGAPADRLMPTRTGTNMTQADTRREERSRLKSEMATDESPDSAVTGNHGAFLYFEYAYELVDFPCLPIALP